MLLSTSSSSQSPASLIGQQLRIQQAQRNADRAEQEARSLQVSAQAAEARANREQENARSLKVQWGQAESEAGQARLGLNAVKSASQALTRLDNRVDQAIETQQKAAPEPVAATPVAAVPVVTELSSAGQGVVNSEGQTTGTVINTTA